MKNGHFLPIIELQVLQNNYYLQEGHDSFRTIYFKTC